MTKITLKYPEVVEGVKVTKNVVHEIEKMKIYQFTALLTAVKDVLVTLNKEGTLGEFLETAFADQKGLANIDEAAVEDMMKKADNEFLIKAVGAFQNLVVDLPEQAINIISILSGVEKATLEQQDFEDLLDIYDAILEVNDVERLISRLKKSLALTVAKMTFLKKVKQATA